MSGSAPPPPVPLGDPWWRVPVLAAGLGALGYGVLLLISGGRATAPVTALTWMGAGLLAHDAVFAPLSAVAVALLLRLVPGMPQVLRGVLAAGALVAASVALVAAPALLSPGIDNSSATPRDYGRGLVILLAVEAAVLLVTVLAIALVRIGSSPRIAGRHRPRRRRDASR
jgi:MFS family permease